MSQIERVFSVLCRLKEFTRNPEQWMKINTSKHIIIKIRQREAVMTSREKKRGEQIVSCKGSEIRLLSFNTGNLRAMEECLQNR